MNRDESGRISTRRATGGLVSALEPVLRERTGTWVGWTGIELADKPERRAVEQALAIDDYEVRGLWLNRKERRQYYDGFSNSVLWPLLHGFSERCEFRGKFFRGYERVNQRFAALTAAVMRDQDNPTVWIQDYHLLLVAQHLRELGVREQQGLFLHIPFPPPMLFARLPWRQQILDAMLAFDRIGFQSSRDLENFRQTTAAFTEAEVVEHGPALAEIGRRPCTAAIHPIGIAAGEMASLVQSKAGQQTLQTLREGYRGKRVILGVDRLDYSKGIPERLHAYERFAEENPQLADESVFVQIVVPSREGVPEYDKLKRDIDRMVGSINSRYGSLTHQPILYHYGSVDRTTLASIMRLADVALVTPLCDGMNLVAKEFCDAHVDEQGVLILSETAGAAEQLNDSLLVNPYNIEQTARAIRTAMTMSGQEQTRRMRALRKVVRDHDVFAWADGFVRALTADDSPGTADEVTAR